MTNSHGYILEYPRIRVDHFRDDRPPLPVTIALARPSAGDERALGVEQSGSSAGDIRPGQTNFDQPTIYLLTHIHSDHLEGLDQEGISAPIYCSSVTKKLLLSLERQRTRVSKDMGEGEIERPYAHLQVTKKQAEVRVKALGGQVGKGKGSGRKSGTVERDLLRDLPLNTPTRISYSPSMSVTLTLLSANHCIGSVMFLIEGPRGAVLHTGDVRAEQWWCESLIRNALLQRYIAWDREVLSSKYTFDHGYEWSDVMVDHGQNDGPPQRLPRSDAVQSPDKESPFSESLGQEGKDQSLRLKNIYLDTESLFSNRPALSKEDAIRAMASLISLYPRPTLFFLNAWTWGYEDMLKGVAKAFGAKVHVDRYKAHMYECARAEDPFLADIVTKDPESTRFHACERAHKCQVIMNAERNARNGERNLKSDDTVSRHKQAKTDRETEPPAPQDSLGPPVVYVNALEVSLVTWEKMMADQKEKIMEAKAGKSFWPRSIIVPLARHSPLPELQQLVGIFRPRMVTPNTILNGTYGLDQYFFPRLFGPFLAPGGKARIEAEARAAIGDPMWMAWEAQEATVAAELAKAGQGDGDLLQHVRPGREKEMQVALDNMAGPEELAGDMKRWLQEDAGHSALSDDEDPDTSGVTAGYDADASQLPTQLPNSSIPMPSPSFNAPSPSLHGPADVTADVPRPPAAPQRPEAEPKTMVAQTQTEVPRVVMSDHLAQRLLARLRHKGHHLKMGQISAMEAWRRVRIKYPDVALHAEESLAEAYGVQAPEWVAAATGEVSVSACEGASKGASPTQERPGPALEQPEYVQFPVAGDEALTPSQHGAASAHNDFTQDSPPLAQEAANDDEQVLDTLESPLEMLGSSHSKYADSDTFDNAPILPPDPHDFVVAYRVILAKLRAGLVLPTMDDTSNDSIWRLPTLSQGQGLLGKHAHAITECLRRDITRSRNILHRADERTSDSSSQEMDEMAVSDAAMRLAALVLQCPEVSDAFDDEDLACILEAVLLLLDSSLRSETRMVSLLSGMEELRIAVARLLELAAWTVQNANLPERIATSYASKAEEALAAYRILQESTETVLNGLNQHQRGERPAVDNVLTSPKTNDAFASSGGAVDARTSKCLRPDRDPNVGTTPDKSVVLHRTESAILMPPPTTPRPSHSASASASASAPPASSSAAAHDLTQLSFGGTSMDETPPSERADADMIEKVMMRLRAGLPLRLGLKCVETQIESQSQSAIQMQVQLHQVHAQRQRQRQTNDINQSVRDRSSSPVVHDGYDSVLDRSLPGARADSPTPTSISISISHRSLSPIGDMHSFPSGSDSLSTSTAPSARVDSQNVRDRIKRIRSERPRMLALSCVETQPGPEEEIEREEDSRQRGLGPRRAGRQEELPERLQQRQQQQSRQRQQRHYHRRGPSPASEGVRGHKRVRSRSPSPSASL